ncbi:hypothetical protein GCM10022419_045320 [Nonomuraea rosea]|uniref:Uncharacterized protein n=1 Tax=Nonomuraea rosea TaxID=638574 RepID=A0ABP6X1Y9_9ACTN
MDYDKRVAELRKQGYSLTQANRQAYHEAMAALHAREEALCDD